LSKNQKQAFLVEPAVRLEFGPESSQTRFEPRPTVVTVVVNQLPSELLVPVNKALTGQSEPTVLSAVQGLTVVRESRVPKDQVETKHLANAHLEQIFHQLIRPLWVRLQLLFYKD
jgi:hypothetical protein